MAKTYGQSTKESYRDDIEISRKTITIYKNYEYFDDYSYSSSDKIGLCIEKTDENEIYLYLFQEDGPKNEETLRKFLEWRRSGKSYEIGHKGGGNKRNIYGFYCTEAFICNRIDDKNIIRCSTKPNSLYELSTSDIDEEKFRSLSDSSTYINNPEILKIKNVPSWYKETYDKIKIESNISPNFLIRLELSKIPSEYNNKDEWNEYINQVRAKQYKVPIYFKNELLSMKQYKNYENIDLVGFNDPDKISEKNIELYINKDIHKFYIFHANKYVDVLNGSTIDYNDNIIKWGEINMFIVSKEYLTNQLKEFNNNNKNTMRQEDFYGVYLCLNDKLTNYLPLEGKLLGDSRNNKINIEEGQQNNGRFRFILKPDKNNCVNKSIFDALIETRQIKALTNFLDKSPYREIINKSIKIYKGEPLIKPPSQKKPKTIKKTKTKEGGVYLVYINNGLWKFGMVDDYDNIDKRINQHKCNSIKYIEEFIDFLDNKENPTLCKCVEIYREKTSTPKGKEEYILRKLEDDNSGKITILSNNGSTNGSREFFICNDFNYIYNVILNEIS